MSDNVIISDSGDSGSGFSSPNCVDLIIDGPGDTTVRPARPVLLRAAMQEREKIKRWEEFLKQQQQPKPEPPVSGN